MTLTLPKTLAGVALLSTLVLAGCGGGGGSSSSSSAPTPNPENAAACGTIKTAANSLGTALTSGSPGAGAQLVLTLAQLEEVARGPSDPSIRQVATDLHDILADAAAGRIDQGQAEARINDVHATFNQVCPEVVAR